MPHTRRRGQGACPRAPRTCTGGPFGDVAWEVGPKALILRRFATASAALAGGEGGLRCVPSARRGNASAPPVPSPMARGRPCRPLHIAGAGCGGVWGLSKALAKGVQERGGGNSIAFGSAPRREADSQPISQLARPAASQTETHSLGFLSVADLGPSSGEDHFPQGKQWPNGNAAGRRLFG